MPKLAIISGNLEEAVTFARGQHLEPCDWFFVRDVSQLIGQTYKPFFIGTYAKREDIDHIKFAVVLDTDSKQATA